MRGINYNYIWFTGCDSRVARAGCPPRSPRCPLRLLLTPLPSPLVARRTHPALLKPLTREWYRRPFPRAPDYPLHSELLNIHVRAKPRRVACTARCRIRGDVKSPACNASAFSRCIGASHQLMHRPPVQSMHVYRSQAPRLRSLVCNCATKLARTRPHARGCDFFSRLSSVTCVYMFVLNYIGNFTSDSNG